MNRNHLITLFLIAVILTLFSLCLMKRDLFEVNRNTNVGKLIFKNYKIDDISTLELIKPSNKQSVILQRKDKLWFVQTLYNYPADLMQISNLLRELALAKIIQNIFIKKADYGALNLLAPHGSESDTSGQGIEIKLLNSNRKLLYSLIAGKKRIAKDANNEKRFPLGRYLLPEGNTGVVFTDSLLYEADYDSKEWLDKSFVDIKENQISEIQLLKNNTLQWELDRKNHSATFDLSNSPADKVLDYSVVLKFLENFKNLKFDSIIQAAGTNEKLIFTEPMILILKLFNGESYEFKIGKTEDDYYYVKVICSAEHKNNKYAPWIYLISKNRIDELLLNKDDFLQTSKTSKKSGVYSWPVRQKLPLMS